MLPFVISIIDKEIIFFQNRKIFGEFLQDVCFIVSGKMKCNTKKVAPPEHSSNGKDVIVLKESRII